MRWALEPLILGMPHLAPSGLSENWLLRFVGDAHWRMICAGLGRKSRDIVDIDGHRLYASFIRARWISSVPLSEYCESDKIAGSIAMVRYLDRVFVSETEIENFRNGGKICVTMASVFSRREIGGGNNRLFRSAPAVSGRCQVPEVDVIPEFVTDHRLMKKRHVDEFGLNGVLFPISDIQAESVEYRFNGFYEFNGANLLYFASYPTIADVCCSRSRVVEAEMGFLRFVLDSAPIARDLFYFGNADLTDSLNCHIFPLHLDSRHASPGPRDNQALRTALVRASDGVCIGQQFTLRQIRRRSEIAPTSRQLQVA